VAQHRGGNTPFSADITHQLRDDVEQQVVIVRAFDRAKDLTQPRGKQYWREQSESIFYTPTMGIWQPVWLEPVPARHIDSVLLVSDIDTCTLTAEIGIAGGDPTGLSVEVEVSLDREQVARTIVRATSSTVALVVAMATPCTLPPYAPCDDWKGCALWSPEHPVL
jgi:beta-galactosidase/beta-glucuronidase